MAFAFAEVESGLSYQPYPLVSVIFTCIMKLWYTYDEDRYHRTAI